MIILNRLAQHSSLDLYLCHISEIKTNAKVINGRHQGHGDADGCNLRHEYTNNNFQCLNNNYEAL